MTAAASPALLRSLGFAAVAALAVVPWQLVSAPVVGFERSLAVFAFASVVAYLASIAPTPRRAWVVGGSVALAAVPGALLVPLPAAIPAAAILLAVGRSVFLFQRSAVRAVVVEGVLLAGGLLFARTLSGPSLLDLALAVWGFFLVQSLFGLIGGGKPRREALGGDPFERARQRAMALMEEMPEGR